MDCIFIVILMYVYVFMFGSIIWGFWRSFYVFKLEVCFKYILYIDLFLNFIFMLVIKFIDNRWYFYFCMVFLLFVVYICVILLWFYCWLLFINNNDVLFIVNKVGSVIFDFNKMVRFVIIYDRYIFVDLIRCLCFWIFVWFRRLWLSYVFVIK